MNIFLGLATNATNKYKNLGRYVSRKLLSRFDLVRGPGSRNPWASVWYKATRAELPNLQVLAVSNGRPVQHARWKIVIMNCVSMLSLRMLVCHLMADIRMSSVDAV